MKLKASLFKKGLIMSNIKTFWWFSALYAIVLLFMLPLNHYIQKFNNISGNMDWLKETVRRDLLFEDTSSQRFLLFVPVIIAVLVFSYIQKNSSASLYHSLPVTRTALYLNSMASSLILFISPLLITALAMFLLNDFSFLSSCYSASLIITWLLYSLLFGLLFISMTAFVGMFTGSSVAQSAFVYILNLLPVFLFEFTRLNLSMILYGFDNYPKTSFYYKMPMFMLYFNSFEEFDTSLLIIYMFLTVIFFAGGLIAFKLRRPETAGDIITFRSVKPLFIYGATVCGMLLGGTSFGVLGKPSVTFIIFGYFASTLVFYAAVQMIINKSLKILHTYKGYIGFALVLAALLLSIRFDISGYINRIPDPADVKETYIGHSIDIWFLRDDPKFASAISKSNDRANDRSVYKDPGNIENTTRLHRMILENRNIDGSSSYIAYKLKNGKKIIRKYPIDTEFYASALGPIYESSEYKESKFPILYQEAGDLKYIEITDTRAGKTPFVVSDKARLESFKTALRKDIGKLDYGELISQPQRVFYIKVVDNAEISVVYDLGYAFSNTLDWLKWEGIYDQLVIKPESIASIALENPNYTGKGQNKKVEITDKKLIQELIDLTFEVRYSKNTPAYTVYLMPSSGSDRDKYSFTAYLNGKISPELKSYIDMIK